MLLMAENGVRGGICHAIHRCVKSNSKYVKDKDKESLNLNYWDADHLCGWVMSQKLPVDGFKWVEDTSQFNKDVIKTMKMIVMRDIFLKFMFSIQENCMYLIMIYHFYLEEKKWKKLKTL